MISLIRRLFFRLWLRRKITGPTADYWLSLPIEAANCEIDTVRRLAPNLTFQQQANVTHRRLQHAALGLKQPSIQAYNPWPDPENMDMNTSEWWDG